jgi:hypothetical protein
MKQQKHRFIAQPNNALLRLSLLAKRLKHAYKSHSAPSPSETAVITVSSTFLCYESNSIRITFLRKLLPSAAMTLSFKMHSLRKHKVSTDSEVNRFHAPKNVTSRFYLFSQPNIFIRPSNSEDTKFTDDIILG